MTLYPPVLVERQQKTEQNWHHCHNNNHHNNYNNNKNKINLNNNTIITIIIKNKNIKRWVFVTKCSVNEQGTTHIVFFSLNTSHFSFQTAHMLIQQMQPEKQPQFYELHGMCIIPGYIHQGMENGMHYSSSESGQIHKRSHVCTFSAHTQHGAHSLIYFSS